MEPQFESLDALIDLGWDVADKYALGSRDGLVPDECDEEPPQ